MLCHSSRKWWIALDIFQIFKGEIKIWDPLFKRHLPQWHLRGMLKLDSYFLFVWFYSEWKLWRSVIFFSGKCYLNISQYQVWNTICQYHGCHYKKFLKEVFDYSYSTSWHSLIMPVSSGECLDCEIWESICNYS